MSKHDWLGEVVTDVNSLVDAVQEAEEIIENMIAYFDVDEGHEDIWYPYQDWKESLEYMRKRCALMERLF